MPLTATVFLRFTGLAETPTANAKAAMKLIRVFIFDSEEPVIRIWTSCLEGQLKYVILNGNRLLRRTPAEGTAETRSYPPTRISSGCGLKQK
jgi:hypothetical protein